MALLTAAQANSAAVVAAKAQAAIDQGKSPSWWQPDLSEEIQQEVRSKGEKLLGKLGLEKALQAKVSTLLTQHYARVWAWHEQVDTRLDAAWAAWDEARNNLDGKEKDELQALAIMTEQIDPLYAEFQPQIRGLIRALNEVMGEAKTVELLDHLTWSSGAPRTYKAYLEMVPQMKDEEKAILWKRMAQAREDCLACWSSKRIVKIFKKYKVRNEFSIDYFGYGYRKHYKAWVASKR